MSNQTIPFDARWEAFGADLTESRGTDVPDAASANTKSSYVELIASTSFDYDGFFTSANQSTVNAQGILFDIAIGAGGSEIDKIGNVRCSEGGASAGNYSAHLLQYWPVHIPAGTRIAGRYQASAIGAGSLRMMGWGFQGGGGGPLGFREAIDHGAVPASSRGTTVDPGTTANTKGGWTEIAASVSDDLAAIAVGVGSNGDTSLAAFEEWMLDIGVGAGGSEVVKLPNLEFVGGLGIDRPIPVFVGPFPMKIPAGSRIAANAQSDKTTDGDRQLDVIVYGFPA